LINSLFGDDFIVAFDVKKVLINPKSSFLRVRCPSCGNEQNVYSNPTQKLKCNGCDFLLAESSGGKAIFKAKIVKDLN